MNTPLISQATVAHIASTAGSTSATTRPATVTVSRRSCKEGVLKVSFARPLPSPSPSPPLARHRLTPRRDGDLQPNPTQPRARLNLRMSPIGPCSPAAAARPGPAGSDAAWIDRPERQLWPDFLEGPYCAEPGTDQ